MKHGAHGPARWPLYFLLFAAAVLAGVLALVGVSYFSGDDAAAPAPTAAGSEPGRSASADLTQLREQVHDLRSGSCPNPESAAATLADYATAAAAGGTYSAEAPLLTEALRTLSSSCGAEYTLSLSTALGDIAAPADFQSFAASRQWWKLVRPAPPEDTRLESFTTPMNNVRCSLDEKAANCTIFTYDYVSPPGCEGEPANYTVGLTGTTTAGCSTQVSTAKEVPYGSVVAAHGFACTADQYAGISCWSELTGHGFTVRRAAEEVF